MLTTFLRRFWWWISLTLLAACGGPLQRVDLAKGVVSKQDEAVGPRVLVVTLDGKVGTTELARCHRTLREAEARDCTHVVFRLDNAGSQGEDVADIESLLDRIQGSSKVTVVAVLRGRVTQGAAAIALCARKTFCLPSTEWGEVTKPEPEWGDLFSASPDEALAQRFDAMRTAMQQRLERREPKLRPDAMKLALAMVDPRIQLIEATVREGGVERTRILDQAELTALQSTSTRVFGERALPRPLMVSAQEAEQYGLTSGTLQDLDQLAEVLLIDRNTIGELTTNWAEDMVGWLEMLQPFLLVAGFLLLLIEIKTPGVGLPGLLGVVFLSLALFHSYLVGLAELTEILVFFLGIAAIAVEIFVLPGMIVFGAVGFLCLVLSLILSRQSFVLPSNAIEEGLLLANLSNLTLTFVLVLVLAAIMWRLLPKVPWFNRVFLVAPTPLAVAGTASGLGLADAALTALVGQVGVAATVLRPTGTLAIGSERYDVVTEGEFVEAGTKVRVLYVQGNRVVVGAEPSSLPAAGRPGNERGNVGVVLLLLVVGLALIVAEVVFVSFGIIGTIAGTALFSAVFLAFQESMAFGVATVVVEAIAAPVVLALSFRLLPKTRFGKALILEGPSQSSTEIVEPRELIGKQGITVSPLRPAGFARIDGRRIDVVTRGELLEADCNVVVLEVSGNRVVVGKS